MMGYAIWPETAPDIPGTVGLRGFLYKLASSGDYFCSMKSDSALPHRKPHIAVIYHIWPHYRQAVAAAMDLSESVEYTFFGSGDPLEGIKHADITLFRHFVRAPFRFRGRLMWQPAAVQAALSGKYDAIIYLGDPNFVSTWMGALIARSRRVPVLFWAHGWLNGSERSLKKAFRKIFFGLANAVLVYGERAKRLGSAAGYSDDKIAVVYNSLDVERADKIVSRIERGELSGVRPQSLFAEPDLPLAICTARITKLCRFDLLIEAAALLKKAGTPINVLLVGDGPERAALEEMAKSMDVAAHFYGACYDEDITGQLTYHADMTVSPGKIGLTSMHTLMYGTPAITHGNLDEQMPEVEAIADGKTGALFVQNDAASLARTISDWIRAGRDRTAVRAACRMEIHTKWNPTTQAAIIERKVLDLVRG